MSDLDIYDPPDNITDVGEFIKIAKAALDSFAINMDHLDKFKNRELTIFEWYAYFGWWNESLNFIDEIEKRLKIKFDKEESKVTND